MFDMKFRIAQCKDGSYTVNQESNGYWWYLNGTFATREDAEKWCESRCGEDYTFEIMPEYDYLPVNMRN